MNRPNWSVSNQNLFKFMKHSYLHDRKCTDLFNQICWYCCTTQKVGNGLTASLQKNFVESFDSIANQLNSAQQPVRAMRLSGEIVLGGFAA